MAPELSPRGWRRDAPTDLAYERGYADARRDVLRVVSEMAETVADMVTAGWLDGLEDGGHEIPDGRTDDDVAEMAGLVRARAGSAFMVVFADELKQADWKREAKRLPTVDDALRRGSGSV